GGAGNASTRILSWNGTVLGDHHTVRIKGASNIRFTNLSILGTNATYAWPVHIMSGSSNIRFKHNIIRTADFNATSSGTYSIPVAINNSNTNYYTGSSSVNNIEID